MESEQEPHVCVWVFCSSEYKYRTRHVMQTLNPEWKETFTFQSIDPNEIHHKQIEITVWDWDRLSADDFLGEVIVDLAGMYVQ